MSMVHVLVAPGDAGRTQKTANVSLFAITFRLTFEAAFVTPVSTRSEVSRAEARSTHWTWYSITWQLASDGYVSGTKVVHEVIKSGCTRSVTRP
jgi:hypothetical protein